MIEKCMVQFNRFTGDITNQQSTSTTIRFVDLPEIERAIRAAQTSLPAR